MKKHKKKFLLATLVIALSVAVYLNWSMATPKTTSKILGESKLVNATVSTSPTEKNKVSSNDLSNKQNDFFASAKIQRKQTQDEIIDKANEILKLEDTSEENRTNAQLQVAGIIKNFTIQDSLETTLKAKAFSECLTFINEEGCIVTVPKKELNDTTSMIIKSTVQSVTNISFDKITIVTV